MRFVERLANRFSAERIRDRVPLTATEYASLALPGAGAPPGVPKDEWERAEWLAGEFLVFDTASSNMEPDDVADAWHKGLEGHYIHAHPDGEERYYPPAAMLVDRLTRFVQVVGTPLDPVTARAMHLAAVERA